MCFNLFYIFFYKKCKKHYFQWSNLTAHCYFTHKLFIISFYFHKYLAHNSHVWLNCRARPTAHVTGKFQTIRTACAAMCFCYPTATVTYVAVPKSMQCTNARTASCSGWQTWRERVYRLSDVQFKAAMLVMMLEQ